MRLGGVALVAVLLQIGAIFAPLGDDIPRRALFLVSYLLLLLFVYLNLRRIGILIIGIGVVLNFLPIAANGGLMPVTPEVVARGDFPSAELGEWVPGTKDVLLEEEDVRLWALGDRFILDVLPMGKLAYSIGDVFITAGLVVFLVDLLVPRIQRVRPPNSASVA